MKKLTLIAAGIFFAAAGMAQVDTTVQTTTTSAPTAKVPLPTRSSDHIVLQFGYHGWAGIPDSIQTGGFSRTFNAYVMFDFPFKTNPHFSAAIGVGLGTDHLFFEDTYVGIKDITPSIVFRDLSDTVHFKKYKLSTAYAEAPIELRWSSNPAENGKSVKVAVGAKVGLMLSAWTKGKKLQTAADQDLNGGDYIEKLKSKNFFNTTRLAVTGRLGYGHFTLFGTYQFTQLFEEGRGPNVKPFSIGLTISGL